MFGTSGPGGTPGETKLTGQSACRSCTLTGLVTVSHPSDDAIKMYQRVIGRVQGAAAVRRIAEVNDIACRRSGRTARRELVNVTAELSHAVARERMKTPSYNYLYLDGWKGRS